MNTMFIIKKISMSLEPYLCQQVTIKSLAHMLWHCFFSFLSCFEVSIILLLALTSAFKSDKLSLLLASSIEA